MIQAAVGLAKQSNGATYDAVLKALPPFIVDFLGECYDDGTGVCDAKKADDMLKKIEPDDLVGLMGDAWKTMPVTYEDGKPLTPEDVLKQFESRSKEVDLSAMFDDVLKIHGMHTEDDVKNFRPTRPKYNLGTIRRLGLSEDPRDKARLDAILQDQRADFRTAIQGAYDKLESDMNDELKRLADRVRQGLPLDLE